MCLPNFFFIIFNMRFDYLVREESDLGFVFKLVDRSNHGPPLRQDSYLLSI